MSASLLVGGNLSKSKSKRAPRSEVSAFALFYDGEGLLFGRKNCGRAVLVGGHVDPGEAPEDAVRREAYEEAMLRVTHLRHLKTFVTRSGRRVVHLFVAVAANLRPQPSAELVSFVRVPLCPKQMKRAKVAAPHRERIRKVLPLLTEATTIGGSESCPLFISLGTTSA